MMATAVFYPRILVRVSGLLRPIECYQQKCNYSAIRKRFYKDVSVITNDGLYEICLDGRRIKTPCNNLVQVKSHHLALMIANEWKTQKDTIRTHEMHLTNLTNTSIDNPLKLTKQALADSILEFLTTDTVCFRIREPIDLHQLQSEEWDPIIEWLRARYNCDVPLTEDVFLPPIPSSTQTILKRHLLSYNEWCLHGIHSVTDGLKSFILSLALIDKHIPVDKAVSLSRLELEYQTTFWGTVEWAHTIELMMTRAKVAAALLFVYTNSESFDKISKSKNA